MQLGTGVKGEAVMMMVDVLKTLQKQSSRLQDRLRELVEVESPSEEKLAVDRAGGLISEWAGAIGGRTRRHRQKDFGDVLEITFGPARSPRSRVLLLGHMDTVWPLGTLAKMPWEEAEGRLSGPGVLDMKAGVVMAIEALAAIRTLGLERPVTLLLNSEEEVGSPISRPITEAIAIKCSSVFVLEPAQGLAYKTARKGVGQFTLCVTGVAAHSGVDFEQGHSAVLEMARLVEKVSGFTNLPKGLTVNVGVIQGGTRSNVVAAECVTEVDVRIAHGADAAKVERKFRALKTTDSACSLAVTGAFNRPPMERKAGTIRLFRQAQQLARELGLSLEEAATGGGSDGNFTAALGVPTLDGMGAVGAGAHAVHEHVVVRHLMERTALLAGMIVAAD